jgi:hypothetical protein
MKFYHVRDWGGCDLSLDFKKIDLLPRITVSEMTGCFFLNLGFLMLTFNLCIYDSATREFVSKMKSGELVKEIGDAMNELREKAEELRKREGDAGQ